MRVLFAGILLFGVLLLAGQVQALENATITFIPNRFSANGSLVMVAELPPGPAVRIGWGILDFVGSYGLLPRVGNKWICFFSPEGNNTCGPSPFPLATRDVGVNYTMNIEEFAANGERTMQTLSVEVGTVGLTDELALVNNSILYMTVFPFGSPAATVEYTVYYAGNMSTTGKAGMMVKNLNTGGYDAQAVLQGGEYFVAFVASGVVNQQPVFGGILRKVSVPVAAAGGPGPEPTTGPAGPEETIRGDAYESRLLLRKGEQTTSPAIRVINQKAETLTNVSFEIPVAMRPFFAVELDDKGPIPFTLAPQDVKYYKWIVRNVNEPTDFNFYAEVLAGTPAQRAGLIKINVSVSVIREGGGGSGLTITPEPVISGDYLVGQLNRTFMVANNGTKTFPRLTGTISSGLTGQAVPPVSLAPKEIKPLVVSLNPTGAGRQAGTVTVSGDGEAVKVYVDAVFYPSMSSSLTGARERLDTLRGGLSAGQAAQLKDVLDTVKEQLDGAESDSAGGRYREAAARVGEAIAVMDALEASVGSGAVPTIRPTTPGGTGTVDMTPFILIAVLLVAVIVGLMIFLRKKGKGKNGEIEDIEKELQESGF